MREIRYLDKLVDELAKGKPMEKSYGSSTSRGDPAYYTVPTRRGQKFGW